MHFKNLLIFSLLLISSQILSQTENNNLNNIERFCCYDLLPEFKDSIHIIVDEREVNQRRKYCVLTKIKRRKYDLHCWIMGGRAIESPTQWGVKLRIRFRKNTVILKFGKEKVKYKISKISKGEFLLIKEKQ
jgi:hypothetical protein